MAKGLTAEGVRHAKASSVRVEIPDGFLPGLYLVIQPSGIKSWAIRYRANGKPVKFTLGRCKALTLADARERGQDVLRKVAEGKNPAADKAKARQAAKLPVRIPKSRIIEFEAVTRDFIDRYAKPKTRDWERTASMFERHFVPHWRGMNIGEIQKSDVIEVIDGMVEAGLGPATDRAFAQLRKMFNWLVENDRLKVSPCAGLKRRFDNNSRDRVLTDEEVLIYWRAAEGTSYPFGAVFKLLLLLGQRLNEVGGMRWQEIDGTTWTIPGSRTKNRKTHDVPLAAQALDVIRAVPRFKDDAGESEFVFTTTGRTAVSGFSRAKELLNKTMLEIAQERAVEAGQYPAKGVVADFTNHDIRRTVATRMAGIGVQPHVIEAVLNHVSGSISGVAAVYNRHKFNDEKRDALQRWADHLQTILTRTAAGNVVLLTRKV